MLLLLLDQILFLLWRLMIIEWQSFLFGCVFALGAGAAVLPLHLAHALGRPRASPLCLEHGFLGTGRHRFAPMVTYGSCICRII